MESMNWEGEGKEDGDVGFRITCKKRQKRCLGGHENELNNAIKRGKDVGVSLE